MSQSSNTSLLEYKTGCGGVIKDPSKYPFAEYRGEQIYFCTRACLRAFEQNPEAFMSGEAEHSTEAD